MWVLEDLSLLPPSEVPIAPFDNATLPKRTREGKCKVCHPHPLLCTVSHDGKKENKYAFHPSHWGGGEHITVHNKTGNEVGRGLQTSNTPYPHHQGALLSFGHRPVRSAAPHRMGVALRDGHRGLLLMQPSKCLHGERGQHPGEGGGAMQTSADKQIIAAFGVPRGSRWDVGTVCMHSLQNAPDRRADHRADRRWRTSTGARVT